jgi:hypothetical protein
MSKFQDIVTLAEALRMMIRAHDPKLAAKITSLEAVHRMQLPREDGKPLSPDAVRDIETVAAACRVLYGAVREVRIHLRASLKNGPPEDVDPKEQEIGDLHIWGETLTCGPRTYTHVHCIKADVERAVKSDSIVEADAGGAPERYDWDEGFRHMRELLDERGDPRKPEDATDGWRSDADVGRAVASHLAVPVPGDAPREPDFRHTMRRIRPELQRWRAERIGRK